MAETKLFTDLDMNNQEIKNALFQTGGAFPLSPVVGQFFSILQTIGFMGMMAQIDNHLTKEQ